MPTYEINVPLPHHDVNEFIEKVQELAGIAHVTITIDAPDRRAAVNDVTTVLDEFENTYSRSPRWRDTIKDDVKARLMRVITPNARKVA